MPSGKPDRRDAHEAVATSQRITVPAMITVSDQGPGIPPDLLPGLYLAHQIALAHGGTLEVSSPPGLGTIFRLSLPTSGGAE